MNEKFKICFDGIVDKTVPVSGQTEESLCLRLFLDQIGHIKDLPVDARQKAEERVGEIGSFISKSPVLYNALADKVQAELGIKPAQLKQLVQRVRRKMREESAKNGNESRGNAEQEPSENAASTKLKAELFQISQLGQIPEERKVQMMADAVLKCLTAQGQLYHHAEIKTFDQCLYFNNTQKRLLPLTGDEFQSWLSHFTGINMSVKLYSFVHKAILVESLSGSNTKGIVPERFWAARENAFYISSGDGRIVKVAPGKVSLEDNGIDGVLFASGYTLAPWKLAEPKDPFIRCRIFSDMKLASPHGLDLLRTWCVTLPTNQQTKPPIVLTGPVGGGKTKTAIGIFELLGLFPRITKPLEDGEEGFWTSMDSGGIFCLDNADTKFKWLPDALAAAATDGKHEKRKLYTDSDVVRQQAKSALIVTSANPAFASDAGLADRLIVVRMLRRKDTEDTSLTREVIENRDAGLSWIAHTLSKVLTDNISVIKGLNKRHPDFATLAVKIGRAIGREQEVIAALQNAESDKSKFNLENDEIGLAIISLIETSGTFDGSAAELFDKLLKIEPAIAKRSTIQRLGKHLKTIWPHLEQVFEAECRPGHGGVNHYCIARRGGSGGSEGGVSYKVSSHAYVKSPGKTALNPTIPTNHNAVVTAAATPEMEEITL